MTIAQHGSAGLTPRLIAISQLACVVLFGVLLLMPFGAGAPGVTATFALACLAFAVASIQVARSSAATVRAVFAGLAALSLALALGELWLLASFPVTRAVQGLQDASSLELAVVVAAFNGLLALYGNDALAKDRGTAVALQEQLSVDEELRRSLETRVAERTSELDDAQRVLQRMWWLGQQITLELDPRRVLDRFLEAVVDVGRADGAALGMLADDGSIEIAAASGLLGTLAGERLSLINSAIGRTVRAGGRWCVRNADEHRAELHESWFVNGEPRTRSLAIIPVQRRGERIGAVVIGTRAEHDFTTLELDRVEAVADLLSVALANAQLFQSMKQAEWRFRTLFRAAPDAVLTVLQATGRVREANDAVRAVFGLEQHQIVGRALSDLAIPEDREQLERALADVFEGRTARSEVQIHLEGPGSRVVALAASRLPEADPPSALLIGRDMTAEREMRVRLMESDRLAAVGELVAGVAHEVNNPLSSISAFAQLLLRDDTLAEGQRESLEVIRSETMRASQVVKDLLAFARRSEPQRVPVDLNAVVQRTVRMRQYQFDEASVSIALELEESLPAVIGDARQLQQVCLNLLSNAMQAMTPHGSGALVLRSHRQGDAVHLDVQDNGPGIGADVRAHIFEPFFTTKREGEGTGLGLSVSYGIITAHGGSIDVAETGPGGTVFRVTLPAVDADAEIGDATRDSSPLQLRSPLAGIRLLFVDDEPALRTGMQAFGTLRGFTVVVAADGASALRIACTGGVDAIVCDLRMPGMDGYAFHERLCSERPGLAERTVFITGDVVTTHLRGSISRQPMLTKPFSFDRVEDAVIAVMRGTPYVPSDRGPHSSSHLATHHLP